MGLVSNREVHKVAYLSSLFVFFFVFVFVYLHGRRMTSWAPLHWAKSREKRFMLRAHAVVMQESGVEEEKA